MLLVVANRHDTVAHAFATRWAAHGVEVLTCADLSLSGWRHQVGAVGVETAVVAGRVVPASAITAVLTRLPCVYSEELTQVREEDRPYVAVEMTAFLLSWLSRLRCPVLNRPTPTCLAGPDWSRERWVYRAAQLGIPVQPVHQHVAYQVTLQPSALESAVTVNVIGDRCIGLVDASLTRQTLRLARLAGADLLAVQYSTAGTGVLFLGAHLWPDLAAPEVGAAVLERLQEAARC